MADVNPPFHDVDKFRMTDIEDDPKFRWPSFSPIREIIIDGWNLPEVLTPSERDHLEWKRIFDPQ